MSKFENAVTWMQNGEIQLLFFVVDLFCDVDAPPLKSLLSASDIKFYDYRGDGVYPVSLIEWTKKGEFSSAKVCSLINDVFSVLEGNAFCVLGMFDGCYVNSEDLVDVHNISNIFAVQVGAEKLIGVEDEIRSSGTWLHRVGKIQNDIRMRYSC